MPGVFQYRTDQPLHTYHQN